MKPTWTIHCINSYPFNCHTHGLEKYGIELSIDAQDSLFVSSAAEILNDIGEYIAKGSNIKNGDIMEYGRSYAKFSKGCSEHSEDEIFLHMTGCIPECEECGHDFGEPGEN